MKKTEEQKIARLKYGKRAKRREAARKRAQKLDERTRPPWRVK